MSAKTLTKDCHCAICGAAMKAGDPFKWHTKSGYRAANQGGGIYERHQPAHADVLVCYRVMHPEAQARQAAEVGRNALVEKITADVLAGTMTVEQALAAFGQQ